MSQVRVHLKVGAIPWIFIQSFSQLDLNAFFNLKLPGFDEVNVVSLVFLVKDDLSFFEGDQLSALEKFLNRDLLEMLEELESFQEIHFFLQDLVLDVSQHLSEVLF